MIVLAPLLFVVAAAVATCVRVVACDQLNGDLPVGTFAINVGAAFALGACSQLASPWPTVVGVAALGALSTWSTVANEVAAMARAGHGSQGLLYLLATVSSGVLAAWIGLQIAGGGPA